MVNFNPSAWGSLLGGILNPNRSAGSKNIWDFIKNPINYDPRYPTATSIARQIQPPKTTTYLPYSGSANAFASSNPSKYIGDTSSSWDRLAASANTKTQSAVPDSDPFVDPYAGFDPEKMVRREFDPQYSLIAAMEGQAKKRYTAAGNEIGQGWDLLAKDIAGRQKGIEAGTKARGKAVAAGFGDVTKKSDAAFDAARASLIEDAKRNGTMETIAPLLAQLASQKIQTSTATGNRQANWGALETELGGQEVEANRLASDNAKWGGIGARADFASRLQGALDELGNRRLETKGNEGAAFNKYGMDIAGARNSARQAWETLQTQRAGQQIDIAKMQADAAGSNTPKPIDPSKLTPSEYLAYVSKGLYGKPGEGEGRAQNAANAVMDVFRQGKGWSNVQAFIDDVIRHNPNAQHSGGDARQLAQLASDYYIRVAGGPNKPYGTNIAR